MWLTVNFFPSPTKESEKTHNSKLMMCSPEGGAAALDRPSLQNLLEQRILRVSHRPGVGCVWERAGVGTAGTHGKWKERGPKATVGPWRLQEAKQWPRVVLSEPRAGRGR